MTRKRKREREREGGRIRVVGSVKGLLYRENNAYTTKRITDLPKFKSAISLI